jgi:Predicted helicases
MHGSGSLTPPVPLAHSPRDGAGAQTYHAHVSQVRRRALRNAVAALRYHKGSHEARSTFLHHVSAAALYHDLGKMDDDNQAVLRGSSGKGLPVKHEDAGVAALLMLKRETSAHLVFAHHAGLAEAEEQEAFEEPLRDGRRISKATKETVQVRTDARLDDYLRRHADDAGLFLLPKAEQPLREDGLTLRLALSCLVDADHGDTAHHYGKEPQAHTPEPRWAERLEALDRYVSRLAKTAGVEPVPEAETRRNDLRRRVYDVCRNAEIAEPLRSCDAPVGSGKTTAIMAHLLQVARTQNLRHIIVILPYTNIIRQSVEVYRNALTLPGEDPREVVAEHHHLADFGSVEHRHLTTLWKAPIIVTTAVQFFETLASYHPARLRKLHELPGSALFIDEVHAALPTHHWGQVWRWLHDWTTEWSGYAVLASGSLPRFWEIPDLKHAIQSDLPTARSYPVPNAPELIPADLRRELEAGEAARIRYHTIPGGLTLNDLTQQAANAPGPRLVILNTVHSAAVVARALRNQGRHVLHLSTALAPVDRERIVERVRALLTAKEYTDWILVATSCVEAGMNFSFRTGFRECASAASLIQIGGRVSREAEHADAAVWHFETADDQLTGHPGLKSAQQALRHLMDHNLVNDRPPADVVLDAMRIEVGGGKQDTVLRALQEAEAFRNYKTVSQLARVIADDTRTVIVSEALAQQVIHKEKVSPRELQRHSVQIWATKIALNQLPLARISGEEGAFDALYRWTGAYDPDFLGYMAGVLEQQELLRQGSIIA